MLLSLLHLVRFLVFTISWSPQPRLPLIIISLISLLFFVNSTSSSASFLVGSENTHLKKSPLSRSKQHPDPLVTPLWNTDTTYSHPWNHMSATHVSLLSTPYQPGRHTHKILFWLFSLKVWVSIFFNDLCNITSTTLDNSKIIKSV